MQIPYTFLDVEVASELHDGWRDDHSTIVLAAMSDNHGVIPVIVVDDQAFGYSEAMAYLKGLKK